MQPSIVQSDVPYQSMNEVSLPRAYQDFTSPVDSGSASRKRTYSVFEGLPSSSFAQPSFNSRGPQNAFDVSESAADPYNPSVVSGAAPKPGNLFWNSTGNEQDLPSGLEMTDLPKHEGDDDMSPTHLDEGALTAYVLTSNWLAEFPLLSVFLFSRSSLLLILYYVQILREDP